MQVASFFVVMRDPAEQRSMIPLRIGEMLFWRKGADNEEIVVEGRIRERDDEGTWDARAIGTDGEVKMIVKNLRMGWFYE
jgi:hypothetical protein